MQDAVVVMPAYNAAQPLLKAYDVGMVQENDQVALKEMARTLK